MCHERENRHHFALLVDVARSLPWGLLEGVEVAVVGQPGAVDRADRFAALCADVEPRLRRALVAAYGPDAGSDAAADALAWAWEHLERLERMANPAGYLWRVGATAARRQRRGGGETVAWSFDDGTAATLASASTWPEPVASPEPAVAAALGRLPERQRAAVLLVHGYGYGLREAADVLGCRVRTLRTHLDRGLAAVRAAVGVGEDDDG